MGGPKAQDVIAQVWGKKQESGLAQSCILIPAPDSYSDLRKANSLALSVLLSARNAERAPAAWLS